jgi:hypothetical protein
VAHLHPGGVDVSTGVESAPGRKDPLLVRDFVLNARQAVTDVVERDQLEVDAGTEEPYDWRDG